MKAFLFFYFLSPFFFQSTEEVHRWECNDFKIEVDGILVRPAFKLDLIQANGSISGRLTVLQDGKIIRVSDLVGTVYSDGSASLSEKWAEKTGIIKWMPNYQSILITNIKAPSFRLNYNSSSTGRAKKDRGVLVFRKTTLGHSRT